jgi:hypothetical protein
MLAAKILIIAVLVVGGALTIWQYTRRRRYYADGTPFAARAQHPAVVDRTGQRYVQKGLDGWVPAEHADEPGVHPMTFRSLTQHVQGGTLYVDRRPAEDRENAPDDGTEALGRNREAVRGAE